MAASSSSDCPPRGASPTVGDSSPSSCCCACRVRLVFLRRLSRSLREVRRAFFSRRDRTITRQAVRRARLRAESRASTRSVSVTRALARSACANGRLAVPRWGGAPQRVATTSLSGTGPAPGRGHRDPGRRGGDSADPARAGATRSREVVGAPRLPAPTRSPAVAGVAGFVRPRRLEGFPLQPELRGALRESPHRRRTRRA
mmetsp:Transcript_30218/g.99977  ORF Transcript_30218/g.99977 Transcript_30218/m.99977 type:complete len:201 (+) Transcript_30218:644-1246(+)